jgi:hypothetical protein
MVSTKNKLISQTPKSKTKPKNYNKEDSPSKKKDKKDSKSKKNAKTSRSDKKKMEKKQKKDKMKKQKKPDSDEELDMSDEDQETSSGDDDYLYAHHNQSDSWFCTNCDQKKTCIIDSTCDKCSNPICSDCTHKYIKAHVDYYTEQQMDIYLNNDSDDEEELEEKPGQELKPEQESESLDEDDDEKEAAREKKFQEHKDLVIEKVEDDFNFRSNDYDVFHCKKCNEHNFEILGLKV